MLFYHVNFDNDFNDMYYPRIPETAADSEDHETARVCLAPAVTDCVQAMASSARNVQRGALMIIKSVEISVLDSNLVFPQVLAETGKVPDALENNEYWYLGPVKFDSVKEVRIVDFECDFALAWSCIKLVDCQCVVKRLESTFPVDDYPNSQELFQAFESWANANCKYDLEDAIWDNLAELPFAQCIKVKRLRYQRTNTIVKSHIF